MEWPEPWEPIVEPDRARALERELAREVAAGHPLRDVPVEAIGCSGQSDDVLFRLRDGSGRLAIVHLCWHGPETPPWPHTAFYQDEADCQSRLSDATPGEEEQ